MTAWISVDDQMPAPDEAGVEPEVLCVTDKGYYYLAHYFHEEEEGRWQWVKSHDFTPLSGKVTHWQALTTPEPSLPKLNLCPPLPPSPTITAPAMPRIPDFKARAIEQTIILKPGQSPFTLED